MAVLTIFAVHTGETDLKMKIKDFSIERYFAKYEFTARYLLSSSDCDGYPMQAVLDLASASELDNWNHLTLGYTETKGNPALRELISQQYDQIIPEKVLIMSPGEANFCLMNVLLEKGDEVICMAPMYQSLYQVAESIGCKVTFWGPEKNSDWYFAPETLEKLVKPGTKMIIVNFPHNPTGFMPSLTDWQKIIEIARKHNIVLFSDEMYRLLISDEKDQIPAACDLYENAVSLWGMSKTFGLAGLRIGWLASQNADLLLKIESFKDYLTICNSAPGELLTIIALRNKDKFLRPNIEKIRNNIKVFQSFQERNPDLLDFYYPKAGSTAFIKLNIPVSTLQYAEKLVEETGIMLLPSETFNYGTSHVRIGFGRQNFSEILPEWEKYHRTNHQHNN